MAAKARALREPDATTVQAARRGYAGVLDRLLTELGAGQPLASITGDEIATVLGQLWGSGHRRPGTATAPR
jgi:hypothetical protein